MFFLAYSGKIPHKRTKTSVTEEFFQLLQKWGGKFTKERQLLIKPLIKLLRDM